MGQTFVAVLIGLAFAAFAAAVVYSAYRLKQEVPDEDREYLDPLPRVLRLIWPLIRLVDYHICQLIPRSCWRVRPSPCACRDCCT